MNHLIQLEEKLDEVEFGIARSFRKINSELKSGKRKDLAQTVKDRHESLRHRTRRKKHLQGKPTAVSKREGGLQMAALKSNPQVWRQFRNAPKDVQDDILKKMTTAIGNQRFVNKGYKYPKAPTRRPDIT
jgi:hypothetical protein